MQRQLGLIKNQKQIIIRNLGEGSNQQTRIMDVSSIDGEIFDTIFYSEELLEDETVQNFLKQESKFTPLQESNKFFVDSDAFEKIDEVELIELGNKITSNWLLQNNIVLLDELFEVVDHLKALWPNDRTAFFEELWHIFKNNLGASNFRIIYNDIEKASKNSDKNALIQVLIKGDKLPNPSKGGPLEKDLMKTFENETQDAFSIVEYNEERGQLTICGNIYKSPFLAMAEVSGISKLQETILSTLVKAISR